MYASFRPEKHPNSARSNCFERISDTTNSWVPKGIYPPAHEKWFEAWLGWILGLFGVHERYATNLGMTLWHSSFVHFTGYTWGISRNLLRVQLGVLMTYRTYRIRLVLVYILTFLWGILMGSMKHHFFWHHGSVMGEVQPQLGPSCYAHMAVLWSFPPWNPKKPRGDIPFLIIIQPAISGYFPNTSPWKVNENHHVE